MVKYIALIKMSWVILKFPNSKKINQGSFMYLAISRHKERTEKKNVFEMAWKSRDTNTESVKGLRRFELLKRNINEEYSLYIFHSEWNDEKDFISWTMSDSFNVNHKNPTLQKNLYLGPPDFDGYEGEPEFEGFKVVI